MLKRRRTESHVAYDTIGQRDVDTSPPDVCRTGVAAWTKVPAEVRIPANITLLIRELVFFLTETGLSVWHITIRRPRGIDTKSPATMEGPHTREGSPTDKLDQSHIL